MGPAVKEHFILMHPLPTAYSVFDLILQLDLKCIFESGLLY